MDNGKLVSMLRAREALALECATVARGCARAARELVEYDAEATLSVLAALDAFLASTTRQAEALERERAVEVGVA